MHKLHLRWLTEGEGAYLPRSRRPHTNPGATPPQVRERVLALREELLARGLDASADTLCWHLAAPTNQKTAEPPKTGVQPSTMS